MFFVALLSLETAMPRLCSVIPHAHKDIRLIIRAVDPVHLGCPQKFYVGIPGESRRDLVPVIVGSIVGLILGHFAALIPVTAFKARSRRATARVVQ